MITSVIKIFVPAAAAFIIGILITPIVTNFLYKYKFWKKTGVDKALGGGDAPITKSLHKDEERKTPRMGGIVVWGSVFATAILIWIISKVFPGEGTAKLDFISRNQTWLPLFTLLVGAIIGLIDDYLVVSNKGGYVGGGLSLKTRLTAVLAISLVGAWWFFVKLGVSSIIIPFLGEINLGLMFIPLFIAFVIGIYSGGIIDGVDGLAGGVFSVMYASYALIAFFNNQIDLSALCLVVVGGPGHRGAGTLQHLVGQFPLFDGHLACHESAALSRSLRGMRRSRGSRCRGCSSGRWSGSGCSSSGRR